MSGALRIDRLRIDAPGLSADEGRRLGQLVAAGLGAAGLPALADIPFLRLDIAAPLGAAPLGADLPTLAARIVAATARALAAGL